MSAAPSDLAESTRGTSGEDRQTLPRRIWTFIQIRGMAPLVVLIGIVLAIGLYDHKFLTVISLTSIMEQSAVLILIATGQCLIVMLGRIDLSLGTLASFGGVVLALGLNGLGSIAIVLALVVTALFGVLNGSVHYFAQVPSFIVTLGSLGLLSGLSLVLSGASTVLVTRDLGLIQWIFTKPAGLPLPFILAVAIVLLVMLAMRVFPLGSSIRGIGYNQRATALSGIRVGAVIISVFAIAGVLAGLAAIFQVAQLQSASATISNTLLLPSIAAVIVGGTAITGGHGGPGRTVFGALIISVLRVGLDIAGVNPAFQPIVYGLIIIIAIAITVNRGRTAVVT